MRYSKQREIILEALKMYPVHPTADALYGGLKTGNPFLSLGTVYRNLNLLAKEGIITRISGFEGKERFDHNTHLHAHFLCESCGKIFDLELPAAYKKMLKNLEKKHSFDMPRTELIMHGTCKDCKKAK